VRADKDSKHEELVKAMDLAKTCGFEKLGILHQN
jgi:biopolymer transport protein ExbD